LKGFTLGAALNDVVWRSGDFRPLVCHTSEMAQDITKINATLIKI